MHWICVHCYPLIPIFFPPYWWYDSLPLSPNISVSYLKHTIQIPITMMFPWCSREIPFWLMVSNIFIFSIIYIYMYGMSSFPLTNSYFSRWLKHVKTTNQPYISIKFRLFPWSPYGNCHVVTTLGVGQWHRGTGQVRPESAGPTPGRIMANPCWNHGDLGILYGNPPYL